MQTAPIPAAPRVHAPDPTPRAAAATPAYAGYQIIRRNGAVVGFEPHKIAVALMKAFLAVHGTQGAASASVRRSIRTRGRCSVPRRMRFSTPVTTSSIGSPKPPDLSLSLTGARPA